MKSPIALFALLSLSYCFGTILRISAVVVLPGLAKEIGIGAAMLGFLSSLFFFVYAATQSTWGSLCGSMGPIRSCAIGLFITSFGSFIFIFADNSLLIGLSRLFTGLGTAGIFVGTLIFAAIAFTPDKYPLLVGLTMTLGNIGSTIAVAPLGILLDTMGIGGLFLSISLCFAFIGSVLWFSRQYDPYKEKIGEANKTFSMFALFTDTADAFFLITKNRTLFAIAGVWATTTAAVITLQGLWGVSWVEAASGASAAEARYCISLVGIGMVLGSLSGGFITRAAKGRSNVCIFICLLTWMFWAAWCIFSFFGADIFYFNLCGLLLGLFSAFSLVFSSSAVKEMVLPSKTATTVGMANMLNFAAVVLLQGLSGVIIGSFPKDALGNYSTGGYEAAFGALLLCQFVIYMNIPRNKYLKLPGQENNAVNI